MLNLNHLSLRVRVAALMLLATLPAAVVGIFYVSYSAGNALHEKAVLEVADQARQLADSAERWDEYLVKTMESSGELPSIRCCDPARQLAAVRHMKGVYTKLTTVMLRGCPRNVRRRTAGAAN